MKKIYAGVGSRETPAADRLLMKRAAKHLAKKGWTLRSGGARGADTAFAEGAKLGAGATEIYLTTSKGVDWDAAYALAADFHPNFKNLDPPVKRLIVRNGFQVLGPNLDDPVDFVLCWTPDGAESETTNRSGGTGQAIRIANGYSIPVLNMKNGHERFIEEMKRLRRGHF